MRPLPIRSLLRIVLLSLPVLAVFASTTLACAACVAWLRRGELTSVDTLLAGTACGLIVWLFVAAMHLRRETLAFEVADCRAFLRRLSLELAELGYRPRRLRARTYRFTPRFTALVFGGWIRAHASAGVARITGPKAQLERLRRRLRLQDFIARARFASDVSRRRQGGHLLKRVHISFRMPRIEGPGLPVDVVRALAEEGAEVTCEVNILAHSFGGIPESVVDNLIRDRLLPRHIQAAVQKEPLSSWVLEAAEAAR